MTYDINSARVAIEKWVVTTISDGKIFLCCSFIHLFIYLAFECRDVCTHPGGCNRFSLVPGFRTRANGGICNTVLYLKAIKILRRKKKIVLPQKS
jgi:hypothetical protein